MTPGPVAPPAAALAWLARAVPASQQDAIGDLVELFANRVESGRRFNRAWFWIQTALLVLGGFGGDIAPTPTEFGSTTSLGRLVMGRLAVTFRHALRRLRYEWRYAVGVVFILGIGIGPAAAMLTVVDRVLLQPLSYRSPDDLGIVRVNLGQLSGHPGLSQAEVLDLRKTGLFAGVEAEARTSEMSLTEGDALNPVSAIAITPGMLPMLGVAPLHGRLFTEADAAGQANICLLDFGVWTSRFGADPGVVGRRIQLNRNPFDVVGVLPRGFTIVTGRAVPGPIDIYVPLRITDSRNFWAFPTLVRLAPHVTVAQANVALKPFAAGLVRQYPAAYSGARFDLIVEPLKDDMVRTTRPALRAALLGVLLLLVVAMANAAALVVARLKTRERDFAIRLAVGAGRGALVADVLMESLLLAALGALLGSMIGAGGIEAARRLVPHTVPRWDDIRLSANVLLYAGGLSVLGLFTCGLLPLWTVTRHLPWHALQSGSTRAGRADGALSRLVLAGAQIALTVVLAFAAIQLVRSARRLSDVDLGFDPNVLTVRVPVDFRLFNGPLKAAEMYERLRDQLAHTAGIDAVGAISHLPLSGAVLTGAWSTDLSKPAGWDAPTANYYAVLPGYFSTVHIPILQGRDFTDVEDHEGHKVIVIDETLARAAFPGVASVVGRTIKADWGIDNAEIVGVVGHVRGIDITREVRPQVYAPTGVLGGNAPLNLTIRTTGDVSRAIASTERAVQDMHTGRAVAGFAMLSDNVAAATSTLRSVTGLVSMLAISAGLLSGIGLYAVIAYLLHERRRSTAIRSALGATAGQLVRLHLRTSVLVMLVALPIGAVIAAVAAPLFASLVFGVSERDPGSLALASVIAVIAALTGTYVPVRRAAATDPILVLRSE